MRPGKLNGRRRVGCETYNRPACGRGSGPERSVITAPGISRATIARQCLVTAVIASRSLPRAKTPGANRTASPRFTRRMAS